MPILEKLKKLEEQNKMDNIQLSIESADQEHLKEIVKRQQLSIEQEQKLDEGLYLKHKDQQTQQFNQQPVQIVEVQGQDQDNKKKEVIVEKDVFQILPIEQKTVKELLEKVSSYAQSLSRALVSTISENYSNISREKVVEIEETFKTSSDILNRSVDKTLSDLGKPSFTLDHKMEKIDRLVHQLTFHRSLILLEGSGHVVGYLNNTGQTQNFYSHDMLKVTKKLEPGFQKAIKKDEEEMLNKLNNFFKRRRDELELLKEREEQYKQMQLKS